MEKIIKLFILLTIIVLAGCDRTEFDNVLRNQENQALELKDVKERVIVLENLVNTVNTEIANIKKLVEALEGSISIASYTELADKSGYELTMTDGSKIKLAHGTKGDKGDAGDKGEKGDIGDASLINIQKDTDGNYYWTLNGQWLLTAEGNKVPVTGRDGQDGKDGITPIMRVNARNQWETSLDGGAVWQVVLDSNGNPVPATGAKGDTGDTGAPGADGKDGKDGVDGKDGADGAPGADGTDGVDGATGPQGPAGPVGPEGNTNLSITETIDAYTIVYNGITYTILKIAVKTVELPAEVSLQVGSFLNLKDVLKINPDNASYTLSWSADTDAISITQEGVVEGKSIGISQAKVNVTSRTGTISATCKVYVFYNPSTRPPMALEYLAEYNLSGKKTFATTWDNNASGYFDKYSLDDAVPEGYHIPNLYEWAGILPLNTSASERIDGHHYYLNEVIWPLEAFNKYNWRDNFKMNGVTYRLTSDFWNYGDNTTYAVRFKSSDNKLRSAFRYQFIGPFENDEKNSRLVITQVYIGNIPQNNVNSDKFWEDIDIMYEKGIKNNIVKRVLPMTGFKYKGAGSVELVRDGRMAEYWGGDSGYYRLRIQPATESNPIYYTTQPFVDLTDYYNAIRPFKDEL